MIPATCTVSRKIVIIINSVIKSNQICKSTKKATKHWKRNFLEFFFQQNLKKWNVLVSKLWAKIWHLKTHLMVCPRWTSILFNLLRTCMPYYFHQCNYSAIHQGSRTFIISALKTFKWLYRNQDRSPMVKSAMFTNMISWLKQWWLIFLVQ